MKKFLKVLAGIIILILVAMIASYLVSVGKLEKLTPEVRKSLPGDFIKIKDGVISYFWKGPVGGNIVVLVHGLSTPKFVWDGNVDALTAAGNRVLAFDHLGRGFSDRPDIIYNAEHYDRELLGLLDALEVKTPVNLVGYSMGGGNVIGFAARHPDRVNKLILIAPAGYVPKYSGLAALVLIPGLGDWLMTMMGKDAMLDAIKKEVDAGFALPNMVEKFETQFKYRGYLPSILSTMRHYPMYDLGDSYEKVGRLGIPTFAIWGTKDSMVPFDGVERVKKAIPHVRIFPVEGAEHSVTYAKAAEVNRILIEVLSE
ncbi:MAG: alpha/beta hydrolase [Deltaproteobacteria bacterium]|nr:alpha/beta hydrolase [Deltaproteobacteria bacterium]